ncbi:MAG: tRNA (adenosine(37)-N6)-threonylcarbamoyltransferase complex ATPase subunit type 1 TsaE [Gemmatimonadales bacterium]|nr:tRNA (adenosine(37)-N6)-threonylcarbamoyltransferase complex ATPase subunit type 1 TsaE [Gemmatimonadales bacterium]
MISLLDEAGLAGRALEFGRTLASGDVVWLEGELGAGKTTFVKALVQGLGVTTPATSPTYGLVHHYDAPGGPVYHVDCFRLRTPEEARDLDWETLCTGAALLIEWPERAGAWAPRASRRVLLAHTANPDVRRVEFV